MDSMEVKIAKMTAIQEDHGRRLDNADDIHKQFTQVVIDIASMKTSLESIPNIVNDFMDSYKEDKKIAAENARENGKRWDNIAKITQELISWQNTKTPVITAMTDNLKQLNERMAKQEKKGSEFMLKIFTYVAGGLVLAITIFILAQMGLIL